MLAVVSKKTPKKQLNSTVPKAKKAALTVLKQTKAPPKTKALIKVSARRSVVVPDQGVVTLVVVVTKTSSHTITLPQRFR